MPRPRSALIVLVLLLASAALIIEASDGFAVNHSATQTITAFGVCKRVTNESATGLGLYVPTASAAEWQSFYANPPAGVAIASCVTPGQQTYESPGTYSFVVPPYTTLTVKVWGGGAGGGYLAFPNISGDGGEQSSFGDTLIANGGLSNTSGGTASGGDINISGGDGGPGTTCAPPGCYTGGKGGDSPNGGTGGAGATGANTDGSSGSTPGAGGGGGDLIVAVFTSGHFGNTSGGGGGAYAEKSYAPGELPIGGSIPIVVGSGGIGQPAGADGDPPVTWGWRNGGKGANGRIEITWE
jgi:hypothetical protein